MIILARTDFGAEDTVRLPCDVVDRNACLAECPGELVVLFNPLIPVRLAQMDRRALLQLRASCIADLQPIAGGPFLKTDDTIITGILTNKIGCQVLDSHALNTPHFLIGHFAGAVGFDLDHSFDSFLTLPGLRVSRSSLISV